MYYEDIRLIPGEYPGQVVLRISTRRYQDGVLMRTDQGFPDTLEIGKVIELARRYHHRMIADEVASEGFHK